GLFIATGRCDDHSQHQQHQNQHCPACDPGLLGHQSSSSQVVKPSRESISAASTSSFCVGRTSFQSAPVQASCTGYAVSSGCCSPAGGGVVVASRTIAFSGVYSVTLNPE